VYEAPDSHSVDFVDVINSIGGRIAKPGNARITSLSLDSRQVQPGTLFAAAPGHNRHGHVFADDAVRAGACAILTDREGEGSTVDLGVPVAVVDDVRRAVAGLSREIYGASEAMTLLGVTGTNGKTSVAYMIAAGLRAAGIPIGLIGTLGVTVGERWETSERTTPEAPDLHRIFRECRNIGIDHVVMEVSSIAASESRVAGLDFDVMVFTNLSQDHLDYHGSMEAYFHAKRSMFDSQSCRQAIVCIDTDWGVRLASELDIPISTVSTNGLEATWSAHEVTTWEVSGPGFQANEMFRVPRFVMANRLCALAALEVRGIPAHRAWESICHVHVPGRMERVATVDDAPIYVDYAHSPDAINRALTSVRSQTSGRLLVVVGAGGDRDSEKRGAMGRVTADVADIVVVTDDNPRSEDPAAIRSAVAAGAREVDSAEVIEITPREDAIRHALMSCRAGDAVMVLGKGAETVQEVADARIPFDDREVVRRISREITS
jgi:UDP-N-acetylmuramoyl-L-alanyl-D-glutamate--2,6-diaminopimelate ligase